MSKRMNFCAGVMMGLAFLQFMPTTAEALKDTIVAIVNDDVITLNDLKDYISSWATQLKLEGRSPEEVKGFLADMEAHGLQKLVEDKLIINAANKKDLKVNEEMVNRRLAEIKNEYPSEEEFLSALLSSGATITDLKNKIHDQIKIKYIIDEEVRSRIFVNPQEVNEYYKSHFEEYQKPERLALDSIYVAKDGDPENCKARADEAFHLLNGGGSFEKLAKEYSQAPSIGVIKKGEMIPSVEKILFSLKVDEVSPVTEVENGFYIFRVKERIPEELAGLDEVKDDIYEKLFQKKFKERLQVWIEKIKKDAFIEIKEQL
jgi:parvulin-like peptidyl-prolyl isomerase